MSTAIPPRRTASRSASPSRFEVDAVRAAVERLQAGGANVLHPPRQEPWGQTTARLLSPGGAVLEVAETPWARTVVSDVEAAGESA